MTELFALFEKGKLIAVYNDKDAAISEMENRVTAATNPCLATRNYEICKLAGVYSCDSYMLNPAKYL